VTTNPEEESEPEMVEELDVGEHAAAAITTLSRPAAAHLVQRPDILDSFERSAARECASSDLSKDARGMSLKSS
jgi:hypothetical protein